MKIFDTCVEDCGPCHWNGSLGYCCSQNCNQIEGQDFGFCNPSDGGRCDGSSTRPTCIADCEPCHRSGSIGFCCSGMCIQNIGDDFGYCQAQEERNCDNTEKPDCIPDCDPCKWSGSMGFCCSGTCIQGQGQEVGYCRTKNSSDVCEGKEPEMDGGNGNKELILQLLPYLLSGIVVIVLAGISLWLWRYWRNRKDKLLSKDEARVFYKGSNKTDYSFMSNANSELGQVYIKTYQHIEEMPYNMDFEIVENAFEIDSGSILGSGQFGMVLKATIHGKPAAVKMVKENADKIYLKALLSELKVLIYLGSHQNIVSLIGAHTTKIRRGQVYVFFEFCELGSLYSFLRNGRNTLQLNPTAGCNGYSQMGMDNFSSLPKTGPYSLQNMLQWCIQISNGLSYLAEKKVIHGDVACRNVLLFSPTHAKLTDFGLSRRLYEYAIYKKMHEEPLPWRWSAVEVLQSLTFSNQSDIWSLGILFWEVLTLGDLPFPGHSWSEYFVHELLNGMCPPQPKLCSDDLYHVMRKCGLVNPDDRPSAAEISQELLEISKKCTA